MSMALVGGVVGGIAGTFVGNPMMGAAIGASLGGGIDQQNIANQNAAHAQQVAAWNADMILAQSAYSQSAVAAATMFSMAATQAAATMQIGINTKITQWNAEVRRAVAEYNASLLEDEAALVWEATELDIFQFERKMGGIIGSAVAGYGASGARIDEPLDTPAQAILDIETERELEIAIMRHNADLAANKLLVAAAHSRWEGEVAARTLEFEGSMNNLATLTGAYLNQMQTAAQGALDIQAIATQGQFDALRVRYGGQSSAYQYTQQGNAAMSNAIANAFNSAATFYNPAPPPSNTRSVTYNAPNNFEGRGSLLT